MPNRASYATYTVKKGDTLAAIAKLYSSSVPAIAQASGIADPNRIEVGQELLIPVKSGAVPPRSSPKTPPQSIPTASGGGTITDQGTSAGTPAGIAAWFQTPRVWFTIATLATIAYTIYKRANKR